MNRRNLLCNSLALSVIGSAPPAGAADLSALKTADLDPFETYIKMLASMTQGAEVCWWFMGALPREIEGIGPVDLTQEETIRVHRTEVIGPGQISFQWKQAGVFREVATGEVPQSLYDPANGATTPQNSTLKSGISKVVVRKTADGLTVANEAQGSVSGQITIDAQIAADRVCLTHTEDKTRETPNGPSTNRTVFKVYASLAELKGATPSVAARGYYGVRNLGSGKVFVNGLMVKAAMDEKLNPIAWERIKAAIPAFFKGDRVAPSWES